MSYTESGPLVLVPQRALLDASSADVELTLAAPGAEMVGKLIAAIAIDLEHTASISYTDSSGAQTHVFGEVGEAVWFYGATLSAWLKFSEGDVLGPASAVDNAIPTFDGSTGKLIQQPTSPTAVTLVDRDMANLDSLSMRERGLIPSPGAGSGTFWVKDDAPNVPQFIDDGDTNHTLAYDPTSATGDLIQRNAGGSLEALATGNPSQRVASNGSTNEFITPEEEYGLDFVWTDVDTLTLDPKNVLGSGGRFAVMVRENFGEQGVAFGAGTLSCDLSGTGAGGIIGSTRAKNRGYYIYFICSADLTTNQALVAHVSGDPISALGSIPTGYTKISARPLFFVHNNGNGDDDGELQRFTASGWNSRSCFYHYALTINVGTPPTSLTAVSVLNLVPDDSGRIHMQFGYQNISATTRVLGLYDGVNASAYYRADAGSSAGQLTTFFNYVELGLTSGLSSSVRRQLILGTAGGTEYLRCVGWERP